MVHAISVGLSLFGLSVLEQAAHAATGPALITRQPSSITVVQGYPASFSVDVDGTPPFYYQWSRGGTPISGATNNPYTIPAVGSADNGAIFAVTVSNALGTALSSDALLLVDPGTVVTQTLTLLNWNDSWKYNELGYDPGTDWRNPGYDDSAWTNGPGVFDVKNNGSRTTMGGQPVGTTLLTNSSFGKVTTYYFRTHVQFTNANVTSVRFRVWTILDDGMILHLNGKEIFPYYVPSGASYTDWATRTVSDATLEGPLDVPATNLVMGDNVFAAEVHQINAGSSDATFGLRLDAEMTMLTRDLTPPVVSFQLPPATATVRSLDTIEVFFNEPVQGVDASDLLINGVPATDLEIQNSSQYVFTFPPPPTGMVQVAWSPTHGITDFAATPNPFAGGSWNYIFDPNALPPSVIINEFMARNTLTLRDEDGDYSDWIELYNAGDTPVNLLGWSLTDLTNNPAQWRFPNVTMVAGSYLVVFASGKNKTNTTGRLHTSFQLATEGEYLGLYDASGNVVSEFSPAYPPQQRNVSYGRDRQNLNILGYFLTPTPGAANSTGGAGFAPEVQFSSLSGTFLQPFQLSLSTTNTNAVIRYILVTNATSAAATNVPTETSPIYSSPIPISASTQVRTRAFQPGLFPGAPKTETYILLNGNAASVSSDIPIVLFYNFGAGAIPQTYIPQPGVIMVFEPVNGRAYLTNPPALCERMGMHKRGSSTLGQAKGNFAMNFWDDYNDEKDVKLLGMPADSDWVFYACDNFEPVMIHNAFMHQLSRDVGRYSPRTRIVEVYLNTAGGAVTVPSPGQDNYGGVYIIEEKIKIGKDRVDIDKVALENTTPPSVTGGYLLKIDRSGSGDATLGAGNASMVFVSPNGGELNAGLRNEQRSYIAGYFNSFYSTLTSAGWTNPVTGYASYIDVDSWIDHHLLNMVAFNIDALRLSAFFYKPRNGKITMGPLWDYDRTLGSTDGRDFNPRRWRSGTSDYGTDMFNTAPIFSNPWYSKLFTDIDFWQKYIDRYQELRRDQFSTNHLHALVDTLANQVRESQTREKIRWGSWNQPRTANACDPAGAGYCYAFNGTYQGEIDFMKKWLTDRVNFMDTNFMAPATLSSTGGWVTAGFTVTITPPANPPNSIIYYTVDGTDPRTWNTGGQLSVNAQIYNGPIVVMNNIRIVARVFNPAQQNLTGANNPPLSSSWSGPVAATYAVNIPPLRITEIMYHPPDQINGTNAESLEFIEFKNISGAPLNVGGYRLRGGVDFVFPNLVLAVGQCVVVVSDLAAFQSKYGTGILVAGQYTGHLNNSGENLVLDGRFGENILDFSYDPSWYPITDGDGFSLVIKDETAAPSTWNLQDSWRPSRVLNGSPGAPDPVFDIPRVVINEALSHADPPDCDAIELFNAETNEANVSGWYLTDNFGLPKKYQIPSGTVIPAGGYLAFYATNSFDNPATAVMPFGLSSAGEQVHIFSADASGNLTGYSHGFKFGGSDYGVSFGRYVISTGEEDFVPQATNTFGTTNAGPKVGPIVIKEIMYHPPTNVNSSVDNVLDEYIEIINITSAPVPLYSTNYATNTWHLRGGVDYDFPTNCTLQAQEIALLVNFDPADPVLLTGFTNKYPLFAGKQIFGPYRGKLSNDGERVTLNKPGDTDTDGTVLRIVVDEVVYQKTSPWPFQADGLGPALVRRSLLAYANDPTNWMVVIPLSIQIQPQSVTNNLGSNVTFSVTAWGSGPLTYQWKFNGVDIPIASNLTANSATLLLTNVTPAHQGTYTVSVSDGTDTILSVGAAFMAYMPPVILQQPDHATIPLGGNAALTAVAKGLPFPLYWKWVKNGAFTALVPTMDTNCTYYITGAQLSDGGDYQVTVTNSLAATNLAQTLRRFVTVVIPPTNQVVAPGANVALQVTANCGRFTRYLSYQWQFNSNNIPGATSSNLLLNNFQSDMSGNYTIQVINASNFVASFTAQVTVPTLDANGDGIPDWWALKYGFSPTASIAALDPDGDGMSNYAEYVAGTDPTDPISYLHVNIDGGVPDGAILNFIAVSNRTYQVWSVDTLGTNLWGLLTNFSAAPTTRTITWTNIAPGAAQRYYRLAIPASP